MNNWILRYLLLVIILYTSCVQLPTEKRWEDIGLTVTAPTISTHPEAQSVTEGQTASFSVSATGTDLQYQWQMETSDISGADASSYTTPATTLTDDGKTYRCVVSNTAGADTSDGAVLTVDVADGTIVDSVTDADGNLYHAVKIGVQIWTVKNLRCTLYNDGTAIPHVTSGTEWSNLSTPGYCFYNSSTDESFKEKWGALYNWYAVNTGKLAPAGWRVPTDDDWTTLENYLIDNGYNYDGTISENKIAKAIAAETDWNSSSSEGAVGKYLNQNNTSGFSALPGGYRDNDGNFLYKNDRGYWWSSTEYDATRSYYHNIYYYDSYMRRYYSDRKYGLSVRLVRDN